MCVRNHCVVLHLQPDQAGVRASLARPRQVPRMLASISEDRVTGVLVLHQLADACIHARRRLKVILYHSYYMMYIYSRMNVMLDMMGEVYHSVPCRIRR